MSIVSIFTSRAPSLDVYEFDAVLEDTLDFSVEVTSYPIESGVRIADHRIMQPIQWSITGAVSNNPLRVQATDFVTGIVSDLVNKNQYVALGAGLFAGWLAGSDATRSSTTLQLLVGLMQTGDPFVINAGDLTLKNMVITRISRTKDPENENGLIFVADLQELITLDRIATAGQPTIDQTRDGDPAQTGIMREIKRGQQTVREAGKAVNDATKKALSGIF